MSEIVNLYVWHGEWSLTKLLHKIRRTSNSRIRILGAEEYAIMGHSDPTNKLVLSKIKKAIRNSDSNNDDTDLGYINISKTEAAIIIKTCFKNFLSI